ncbi:uncharacterized protein PpBr36_06748 [Pyricularia pennisetigena]|uniref:uncharacterized protein n=1 Tax=Pyricularia pennisetigena TaxID=1578925 RepID=UPI001153F617|nr:uncharacterized protein PpBr36_06748 [Pyricularia pennisetigena]TLS22619.1 hypothetical protein PpBr36_06748 [Pyricularia pennisetigena]
MVSVAAGYTELRVHGQRTPRRLDLGAHPLQPETTDAYLRVDDPAAVPEALDAVGLPDPRRVARQGVGGGAAPGVREAGEEAQARLAGRRQVLPACARSVAVGVGAGQHPGPEGAEELGGGGGGGGGAVASAAAAAAADDAQQPVEEEAVCVGRDVGVGGGRVDQRRVLVRRSQLEGGEGGDGPRDAPRVRGHARRETKGRGLHREVVLVGQRQGVEAAGVVPELRVDGARDLVGGPRGLGLVGGVADGLGDVGDLEQGLDGQARGGGAVDRGPQEGASKVEQLGGLVDAREQPVELQLPLGPAVAHKSDVARLLQVAVQGAHAQQLVVLEAVGLGPKGGERPAGAGGVVAHPGGDVQDAEGDLRAEQEPQRAALQVEARCAGAHDADGVEEVAQPDQAVALGPVQADALRVGLDAVLGEHVGRRHGVSVDDGAVLRRRRDVAHPRRLVLPRAEPEAARQRQGAAADVVFGDVRGQDLCLVEGHGEEAVGREDGRHVVPLVLGDVKGNAGDVQVVRGEGGLVDKAVAPAELKRVPRRQGGVGVGKGRGVGQLARQLQLDTAKATQRPGHRPPHPTTLNHGVELERVVAPEAGSERLRGADAGHAHSLLRIDLPHGLLGARLDAREVGSPGPQRPHLVEHLVVAAEPARHLGNLGPARGGLETDALKRDADVGPGVEQPDGLPPLAALDQPAGHGARGRDVEGLDAEGVGEPLLVRVRPVGPDVLERRERLAVLDLDLHGRGAGYLGHGEPRIAGDLDAVVERGQGVRAVEGKSGERPGGLSGCCTDRHLARGEEARVGGQHVCQQAAAGEDSTSHDRSEQSPQPDRTTMLVAVAVEAPARAMFATLCSRRNMNDSDVPPTTDLNTTKIPWGNSTLI